MRTTHVYLIAICAMFLVGCGGGGGNAVNPGDANTVALHLFPRTIYTITGRPVELSVQALMDDGCTLGVEGICQYFLDDPSLGSIKGSTFTAANPGSCKLWAVFEGVASETREVVVDDDGDPSIEALDSKGHPARRFRLTDSLYYSGKGLQPLTHYSVELTDQSGNALTTLELISDAWGNIPPTPIWLDIGASDVSHGGDALSGLRWGQAFGQFDLAVDDGEQNHAHEIVNIVENKDPYCFPAYYDGSPSNTFHPTIDIYAKGGNFAPEQRIKLLVLPDKFSWAAGDSLANPLSAEETIVGTDGMFLTAMGKIGQLGVYDLIVDIAPFSGFLGPEDLVNGVMTIGFTVQEKVQLGKDIITQVAGKRDGPTSFHFADIYDCQNDDVFTWVNPPVRPFVSQVGKPKRYIVDHKDKWAEGEALLDITSLGEQGAIEVGCWNSPPVLTDPAPRSTGLGSTLRLSGSRFADVVLDTNQNGTYEPGIDILDNIIDPQDPDLLSMMEKTGNGVIPPGARTVQINGQEFYQFGGIYISDPAKIMILGKILQGVYLDIPTGQVELEGHGIKDFTATAVYKDKHIEDCTADASWHTSDESMAVPKSNQPGRIQFIGPGRYEIWADYQGFSTQRENVEVHDYAAPEWNSTEGVRYAKYMNPGAWCIYFNKATDVSIIVSYRLYIFEEYPKGNFTLASDVQDIETASGAPDYDYSVVITGLAPSKPLFLGLRAYDKYGLETNNTDVYYCDPYAQPIELPPGWLMYGHDPQHTSRADFAGPTSLQWGSLSVETAYSGVAGYPNGGDEYPLYVMLKDKLVCITYYGEKLWEYIFPFALDTGDYHIPTVLPSTDGAFVTAGDKLYHIVAPGQVAWEMQLPGRAEGAPTVGPNYILIVPCEPDYLVAVTPGEGIFWQQQIPGLVGLPAMGHNGLLYAATGNGIAALSPGKGSIIFTSNASGAAKGPLIAEDGTIYLLKQQHVVALTSTGELKWDCPVPALHGNIFPPALGANGRIYFVADEGLCGVNADGTLAFNASIILSQFIASPTVDADGRVYLTTVGNYMPNRYLSLYSPDGVLLKKIEVMPGFGECQPNIVDDGILFVGLMLVW